MLKEENHIWSNTSERDREIFMFFMMEVIDFLTALIESTADIHWSTEFITAVLILSPKLRLQLEKIWIFAW